MFSNAEIVKMFKSLSTRLFEAEKKLSQFTEMLNNQTNETVEQNKVDIEDAVIENDVATDERITQIEDALIEIDEQINGGNENG